MANALYDAGREAFLAGDIDWLNDDIRLILIDTADYTKDLATDDFLDDIAAAARVATSGSLAGKTTTAGVADADDVTLSSVSGDVSEELVGYQHTGTESTSRLIFNIDNAVGLPITPDGGDIIVIWSTGNDRIFRL